MRIRPGEASRRGFTLIEMAIVVAVVAVLSTAAFWIQRAASRDANLGSAAYALALKLSGLRDTAMAAGEDHLLVVVNAPGGGSGCGIFSQDQCTRWFVLKNPAAGWTLDSFDPANPATGTPAQFVSSDLMPRGVSFSAATVTAPAPFTAVTLFDSDLTTTCTGGNTCFAIRFTQRGEVRGEFRSSVASVPKPGYLFAMGTDVTGGGADRKAMLVSFPTGIVKTFSF